MRTEDFILWMKGVADIIGDTAPTEDQWDLIKDKLDTVDINTNFTQYFPTTFPTSPFGVPLEPKYNLPIITC